MSDAGGPERGEDSEQSAGEPPTGGVRGGGPSGHHDSGRMAGNKPPTAGAEQDLHKRATDHGDNEIEY